ncbi:tetratricopeptide repeat-containing S1 family peptidase [Anabaena lutea]|uniref:Tetratricopeptide repeat protein n=1 Tax=Anabaena lutea FACHB-196 TaxID=2692881 RepID=A0ABR8FK82_9NOST|nr:tetratricopeptide repeat protein [Anabaena lutea]MBD2570194.1 tetratricopeptide repeat protein [Anabaena lutea FACHB-196]
MHYKYTLPTLFILTSLTLTQPATGQGLSCSKEIDVIAEKITVLIDNGKYNGSGTLIKKDGNTYTVLTAFHNFRDQNLRYTIFTPDGQRYPINVQNIKPLGTAVDLTMVQFSSNRSYQVAKFGNSDVVQRRDNVYVGGFRPQTGSIPIPLYDCFNGEVSANAKQVTVDGGYNLVYTNQTLRGMSGGPVLNQQGELIGIHGRGDEFENRNLNRYAGIPINTFIRLSTGVTAKPRGGGADDDLDLVLGSADDYFALGLDKQKKGDKQGAIVAYNEAIKINPNYAEAYYNRGNARSDLGDKQGAIADYNQAININPNDAQAYYNRGVVRSALGDNQGAIADYSQAININPNDAIAHYNRGLARDDLGDKQGAIADFNQAIKINPNYAKAYSNRGVFRDDLGDKQGAITDYNQAIKINPNYADAYINRGTVRSDLGDKQGAIADFNQAIKLNPNFALAYYNRGTVRRQLGDNQGAIADYNQAIKINPNYANAYYNRGNAYSQLGNTFQAISDFQQSAKLSQQQGKNEDYQDALNRIRQLQQ